MPKPPSSFKKPFSTSARGSSGGRPFKKKTFDKDSPRRSFEEKDRGPRPEGSFEKRPFRDRGPRPEGSFEKRPFRDRGPRPEGSFEKRPFRDRGPRPEGSFEKRPFRDRGPRPEGSFEGRSFRDQDSFERKSFSQPRGDKNAPLYTVPVTQKSLHPQGVLLWGRHCVSVALKEGRRRCLHLYVTPDASSWAAKMAPQDVSLSVLPRHHLQNMLPAQDAVHQGIVGVFEPLPEVSLTQWVQQQPERSCAVLLDHLTDPQNVGAIVRSAAAWGLSGVIVPNRHSASIGGVVAKASCGMTEVVPIITITNVATTLSYLAEQGFDIVGLSEKGREQLGSYTLPERVIFVLGGEGEGMRPLTHTRCSQILRIALHPLCPSLNVSVAAGVAFYERWRQENLPFEGSDSADVEINRILDEVV